jgi:dTDP-4-dehydrorhamnose 3,5-epimerase
MEFIRLRIPDVIRIRPDFHQDARGFFMEVYESRKFAAAGIPHVFVQDNQSGSGRGVLRGLHYQIRQPQGKLVRAVAGEVFDAAVDLRRASPTFGLWTSALLSAENRDQLWIPPGFAHGFYVLSKWAEVAYKATDFYAPEWERALLWNDPAVGIEWPLLAGLPPTLSPKDAAGMALSLAETYEGHLPALSGGPGASPAPPAHRSAS